MIFKLIIFLLQHIGNANVWCNSQVIKAGNYFTDKAQNDTGLDNFLEQLKIKTKETRYRIKQKRNK